MTEGILTSSFPCCFRKAQELSTLENLYIASGTYPYLLCKKTALEVALQMCLLVARSMSFIYCIHFFLSFVFSISIAQFCSPSITVVASSLLIIGAGGSNLGSHACYARTLSLSYTPNYVPLIFKWYCFLSRLLKNFTLYPTFPFDIIFFFPFSWLPFMIFQRFHDFHLR